MLLITYSVGNGTPYSVVLWHGMGDDCCNPQSMGRVTELIQKVLPGVFVHSVQVGETRQDDHEAGFFGQVNDQVCIRKEREREKKEEG